MSLVRDAAPALYLVGMITDINEQRALAELQESEARFRAVYENAASASASSPQRPGSGCQPGAGQLSGTVKRS